MVKISIKDLKIIMQHINISFAAIQIFPALNRLQFSIELNFLDIFFLIRLHAQPEEKPEDEVQKPIEANQREDQELREKAEEAPVLACDVLVYFIGPGWLKGDWAAEADPADERVHKHDYDGGDEELVLHDPGIDLLME